jgi:ATP-dependent protease ClpP protease subunit
MLYNRPHYNLKPFQNKKKSNNKSSQESIYETDIDNTPLMQNNNSDKSVTVDGNHIYFHSGVNDESVAKLIVIINNKNNELKRLQKNELINTITPNNLWLHITSYGGGLFACFRAIDAILNSELPIYTIVDGYAASAGTLMAAVGKKRYMTANSYMLIHQLSSGGQGNFWQLKDKYDNWTLLMEDIYNIYLTHTKMTREELEGYLSHDSWWKLDKCVECGLVDGVYKGQ